MENKDPVIERRVEAAKEFLGAYRMCEEMLGLRRYERKRARIEEDEPSAELLAADELYWKTRMYEVQNLLGGMKNGREKILLYYRYVRGESVERVSDLMGFSRRTGYRLFHRGLALVGLLLERMEKRSGSA